jgi:anti-sigma regulatory factor (Ser/Thr protein kinase)
MREPGTARLYPSHPSIFPNLRAFLRQRATEAGLGQEATEDLVLATCEACANALRHTISPHILLTWRARRQAVEVLIEDEGFFRTRAAVLETGGASGAGLGIPLMVALTDEFAIKQGTDEFPGTQVRLVKYLR